MSGFIRTLEKRILKRQGYRRSLSGQIINIDGDDVGVHYPRLVVKKKEL